MAGEVAAEDENLVGFQFRDPFRCIFFVVHVRLFWLFLTMVFDVSCDEPALLLRFWDSAVSRLRAVLEQPSQFRHRLVVVIAHLVSQEASHDGSRPSHASPAVDVDFHIREYPQDLVDLPQQVVDLVS